MIKEEVEETKKQIKKVLGMYYRNSTRSCLESEAEKIIMWKLNSRLQLETARSETHSADPRHSEA